MPNPVIKLNPWQVKTYLVSVDGVVEVVVEGVHRGGPKQFKFNIKETIRYKMQKTQVLPQRSGEGQAGRGLLGHGLGVDDGHPLRGRGGLMWTGRRRGVLNIK